MTIGKKITTLRNLAGISQEQLAEHISVSRQAISRWEMGQAVPQLETILQLCEFFGISTDELLQEKHEIQPSGARQRNRYFVIGGSCR